MQCALVCLMLWTCIYSTGCAFLLSDANEESGAVEPVMLIDDLNLEDWAWEPASIKNADVNGLTLELVVAYRGGCADHSFNLLSPPNLAESYPPQHSLFLTHDAEGETCEAKQEQKLRFDLSPLKNRYQLPLFLLRLEEPGATESYESLLPLRF